MHSIDVIDNNIHERHCVKEAIEKACKKVLEEKLLSETLFKWSRKIFRYNHRKWYNWFAK